MPTHVDRRSFLLGTAPSAAAALAMAQATLLAQQARPAPQLVEKGSRPPAAASPTSPAAAAPITEKTVFLAGDAAPVSQAGYLRVLTEAIDKHDLKADNYLAGGAVTELEERFAAMLAKEDCCFLPTGTLANNLAVRILCGGPQTRHHPGRQPPVRRRERRALHHERPDHAAADTGQGRAHPEEFKPPPLTMRSTALTRSRWVPSPLRVRCGGTTVSPCPFATLEKVCALAKSKGIGMHWDGARAQMLTGTPGFDIKRTAAQFDTVYLSLYKALRAPFGAVLAGPKPMIAQARELRHVFGGLIYHGWVGRAARPGRAERL